MVSLLQLTGVYYNWKTEPDKNRQIGFIAQDVEKILPEVVVKDTTGNYSMVYGNLTAVLIEAIKEQQQIINSQQAEINALKARDAQKTDKTDFDKLKLEFDLFF